MTNIISCIGSSVEETKQIWSVNNCPLNFQLMMNCPGLSNIQENYYVCPFGTLYEYDEGTADKAINDMYNILTQYISQTPNKTFLGSGISWYEDLLVDTCLSNSVPGLCSKFQESWCSIKNGDENITDNLLSMCGCYFIQPKNDNEKIDESIICSSLCNRSNVSQRADSSGKLLKCDKPVCIFDDVSVNAISSTISGSINFNSVCGSCNSTKDGSPSNCQCIINSDNIPELFTKLGIGNQINSYCNENSNCFEGNDSGKSCSNFIGNSITSNSSNSSYIAFSVLIFIIFFIVILVVMIYIIKYEDKHFDKIFNIPKK